MDQIKAELLATKGIGEKIKVILRNTVNILQTQDFTENLQKDIRQSILKNVPWYFKGVRRTNIIGPGVSKKGNILFKVIIEYNRDNFIYFKFIIYKNEKKEYKFDYGNCLNMEGDMPPRPTLPLK